MGAEYLQDMPNGNAGVSTWKRGNYYTRNYVEMSDRYEQYQRAAERYATKRVPFACGYCIDSTVANTLDKEEGKIHYFSVVRCAECNAKKNRHQRTRKYAKRMYSLAVEQNYTVWAITLTLGNEVEKRVGYTTVDKLRKTMMYKMNRMRERSQYWSKWIVGGYQVFEHTVKEKDGVEVYHPHLHIVAVSPLKRLPLKKKEEVTVQSLVQKHGFGEYVYVTQAYYWMKPKEYGERAKKVYATTERGVYSAVRYAMKYATKDTGGSRKLSSFGTIRGYTNELKEEIGVVIHEIEDTFEDAHRRRPLDNIGAEPREPANYWQETSLEDWLN